ncbi:protein kinase domain-containing protein [Nocardia sp. NPDC004123]
MVDDDPQRTRRDMQMPVLAELSASGFEDVEEIGHGGFGAVYRCRQVALDRTVAVKVLTAELDADNQARFFREQQAMGRLTGHPNIVTVLHVGVTASGRPYLVMPYYPLDSLDARIRREGPMPVETVLQIGVKIAGALAVAHRVGIVHRDVKPGNILLTDYGDPAVTDFGIARIAGGFETDSGVLTGSPAFTAPEMLSGDSVTPAADVYGLGATLFSALTGHAAYERLSGEQVVAQFLRITSQPIPDLRDRGISGDLAALVESAMNPDPAGRPSVTEFGEAMQDVQRARGDRVTEMAFHRESTARPSKDTARERDWTGGLQPELTSFIDRRAETVEVKNLLAVSRLVTLAGIGGVGKTRLALRAASNSRSEFGDGVRVIALADVHDPSLLVDVVAAGLGLRGESARPMRDVLIEFLRGRNLLLVLDNGEQVVEALAVLVEAVLSSCPNVRVLVTSREPLDIAGEAVVRVLPLSAPSGEGLHRLRGLPKYDAVTLFAERAAAVVPGFEITDDNKDAVAGICSRLDGLPLAIELAAARMRTMSPEQILQRMTDRYTLLTRSIRTAPRRQQTLRWCIDWSYQLCTPIEQQLWVRLSIFAGGFELDAAEQVCGADWAPEDFLDALSTLVDKSIVLREERDGTVRFRMLETVREYGREQLRETGESAELGSRHRNWFLRMVVNAESEWISERQIGWLRRLEREQANVRDALEFSLSEDSVEAAEAGLSMAAALFPFWSFRGMQGEGRRWLERVLAHPRAASAPGRLRALHANIVTAALQRDTDSAEYLLAQARAIVDQDSSPMNQALIGYAEGAVALYKGDAARAVSCLTRAVDLIESAGQDRLRVEMLMLYGVASAAEGDIAQSINSHEELLAITERSSETLFRAGALWGLALAVLHRGHRSEAQNMLQQSLQLDRSAHSPVVAALDLEGLAWTVAEGDPGLAAVLMGAAERLLKSSASEFSVYPELDHAHHQCETEVRRALGDRRFETEFRRGLSMSRRDAVAVALEEPKPEIVTSSGSSLTKRERQVAELVAQGLTNRQIATKLVISQRTAQGHVEHILTKLGFTSRAQIAAWVVESAGSAEGA